MNESNMQVEPTLIKVNSYDKLRNTHSQDMSGKMESKNMYQT